jgi:hypothetical protein
MTLITLVRKEHQWPYEASESNLTGAWSPGISIFALDPGETTGWSWCCFSWKELVGLSKSRIGASITNSSIGGDAGYINNGGSHSHLDRIDTGRAAFQRVVTPRGSVGRGSVGSGSASVGSTSRLRLAFLAARRGGRFDCGEIEVKYGRGRHMFLAEAETARKILELGVRFNQRTNEVSYGQVKSISHVLIEDFLLRERSRARNLLSPVRLTSQIVTEFHQSSSIEASLHFQQPADALKTVTDEVLKDHGVYTIGKRHARDATRHLLLFMRKVCDQLDRSSSVQTQR